MKTSLTSNAFTAICHIILCVTFSVFAFSTNAESIRIGYFESEPGQMTDPQGRPGGLNVEYFQILAEQMGIDDVRFISLPLARLTYSLADGQIDAVLVFAKNPEREAQFRYPETPMLYTKAAIAVKTLHPLQEVASVDDLLPLTIGYLGDAYLSPIMRNEHLTIDYIYGANAHVANFQKLLTGRIDAFYIPDTTTLRYYAEKYGYASEIRILELPETPTAFYTVFSKQSAEQYLERYEVALRALQASHPYEQFSEEYLNSVRTTN